MENFCDYDGMLDFVEEQVLEKENITVAIDIDDLLEIKDKLIDDSQFKEVSVEINDNIETYFIERVEDELYIEPATNSEGKVKEFSCDLFINVDDALLEDEIRKYGDFDESYIIYLDENECCECCNCNECEEEFDDSVIDEEVEGFLDEQVKEFRESDETLADFVKRIYAIAYEDGVESTKLGLIEILSDEE